MSSELPTILKELISEYPLQKDEHLVKLRSYPILTIASLLGPYLLSVNPCEVKGAFVILAQSSVNRERTLENSEVSAVFSFIINSVSDSYFEGKLLGVEILVDSLPTISLSTLRDLFTHFFFKLSNVGMNINSKTKIYSILVKILRILGLCDSSFNEIYGLVAKFFIHISDGEQSPPLVLDIFKVNTLLINSSPADIISLFRLSLFEQIAVYFPIVLPPVVRYGTTKEDLNIALLKALCAPPYIELCISFIQKKLASPYEMYKLECLKLVEFLIEKNPSFKEDVPLVPKSVYINPNEEGGRIKPHKSQYYILELFYTVNKELQQILKFSEGPTSQEMLEQCLILIEKLSKFWGSESLSAIQIHLESVISFPDESTDCSDSLVEIDNCLPTLQAFCKACPKCAAAGVLFVLSRFQGVVIDASSSIPIELTEFILKSLEVSLRCLSIHWQFLLENSAGRSVDEIFKEVWESVSNLSPDLLSRTLDQVEKALESTQNSSIAKYCCSIFTSYIRLSSDYFSFIDFESMIIFFQSILNRSLDEHTSSIDKKDFTVFLTKVSNLQEDVAEYIFSRPLKTSSGNDMNGKYSLIFSDNPSKTENTAPDVTNYTSSFFDAFIESLESRKVATRMVQLLLIKFSEILQIYQNAIGDQSTSHHLNIKDDHSFTDLGRICVKLLTQFEISPTIIEEVVYTASSLGEHLDSFSNVSKFSFRCLPKESQRELTLRHIHIYHIDASIQHVPTLITSILCCSPEIQWALHPQRMTEFIKIFIQKLNCIDENVASLSSNNYRFFSILYCLICSPFSPQYLVDADLLRLAKGNISKISILMSMAYRDILLENSITADEFISQLANLLFSSRDFCIPFKLVSSAALFTISEMPSVNEAKNNLFICSLLKSLQNGLHDNFLSASFALIQVSTISSVLYEKNALDSLSFLVSHCIVRYSKISQCDKHDESPEEASLGNILHVMLLCIDASSKFSQNDNSLTIELSNSFPLFLQHSSLFLAMLRFLREYNLPLKVIVATLVLFQEIAIYINKSNSTDVNRIKSDSTFIMKLIKECRYLLKHHKRVVREAAGVAIHQWHKASSSNN